MTIRPATPADLTALVRVARQAIHEAFSPAKYPGNPVEAFLDEAVTYPQYAAAMQDKRTTFWLAEDGGELVGFLKLRRHAPPRRMTERNALEIVQLYLIEQSTGRGWGRQLMTFALDYALSQGQRAVWLGVWEHNLSARAFYEKMGFTPFGWHVFPFGGELQRDIWMQRVI